MAVGTAPAYKKRGGLGRVAYHLLGGDVVGDPGYLLAADFHHAGVIGAVGRDCAGLDVLFKAAEAVWKGVLAGDCPVARKRLRVAHVGAPGVAQLRGHARNADFGIFVGFGNAPGRGAVADEGIGEQDYRGHVLDGDARGLEGHVEAVGGTYGRYDGQGRLAVASVESLVQVGLLGFGGEAGGGAAALHVDYHQRQFGHHGQTDSLAFQSQTGAGGGGNAQRACKRGADGRAYACNFILHLAGFHAEVLALCKLVENVGGGGDGVAAQIERTTRLFGGHNQTPGRGLVTLDICVYARADLVGRDAVGRYGGVYVVAVVVAGAEHLGVGFVDGRFLCEFFAEHLAGALLGAVEEPAEQSQSEYIAAFEHRLEVHPLVGQSRFGHRRDGHLDHLGRDSQFLDGVVGGEFGFAQALGAEGVDVDDDDAAGLEEAVALLEGGRIHGHEHVAGVAGSVHAVAHAHLETADAAERALRGTDFSRIVGESRDGIAQTGRNVGENVAGKLHAVAGVARKAHGHFLELAHAPGGLICVVHDSKQVILFQQISKQCGRFWALWPKPRQR